MTHFMPLIHYFCLSSSAVWCQLVRPKSIQVSAQEAASGRRIFSHLSFNHVECNILYAVSLHVDAWGYLLHHSQGYYTREWASYCTLSSSNYKHCKIISSRPISPFIDSNDFTSICASNEAITVLLPQNVAELLHQQHPCPATPSSLPKRDRYIAAGTTYICRKNLRWKGW